LSLVGLLIVNQIDVFFIAREGLVVAAIILHILKGVVFGIAAAVDQKECLELL
jgi:hypothetical protein